MEKKRGVVLGRCDALTMFWDSHLASVSSEFRDYSFHAIFYDRNAVVFLSLFVLDF